MAKRKTVYVMYSGEKAHPNEKSNWRAPLGTRMVRRPKLSNYVRINDIVLEENIWNNTCRVTNRSMKLLLDSQACKLIGLN